MKPGQSGPAEVVQISAAKRAVVSGPGAVYVIEGRVAFYLDEREMLRLVEAWLRHEQGRRAGGLPPSIVEIVNERRDQGGA